MASLLLLLLACPAPTPAESGATTPCDADEDGYPIGGDACRDTATGRDCDDADPEVHPGALERCDGLDNDCSGAADDGADADGDGAYACADCDEGDPLVHPGAAEACDGLDNDCSGLADEPYDADGDGVSPCGGDCDDGDPRRAAGLPELCNGFDDNCDGTVDEGFDADGDGWLTCRGDCDDADPAVYYGAAELCDGTDNDCDAAVDDEASCWGCGAASGWIVCLVPATWESARSACSGLARGLAEVYDPHTNAALAGTLLAYTSDPAWIGASDDEEEGVWAWESGAVWGYAGWAKGQPDDDGGQDCAAIDPAAGGGWADEDCHDGRPFVCF